jgi:hypothetical protein
VRKQLRNFTSYTSQILVSPRHDDAGVKVVVKAAIDCIEMNFAEGRVDIYHNIPSKQDG